jgi:phosphoglycolate phosphatase-like HAD superfamily hydrolase
MRRLAVFDIDGTLTDTNAVDGECYVRAVGDVLELDPKALDWTDAPHVSDSALLDWLGRRHSRPVGAPEHAAVLHRFVELLREQLALDPQRFRPIAGAREVRSVLERAGWRIALATGAWSESARLKLAAIGFDTTGIVMATSSDAPTRTEIVRLAADRARQAHGEFDRIVSIGDAVWDVQTAAIVGWPFVGIASGERSDRLRAAGATCVLHDLADERALLGALSDTECRTAPFHLDRG